MSEARFIVGDVFEEMAKLPDDSVNCLITSPPFLALRSYLPADHPDKAKEIGSEPTPAAFLTTLLALTREWRRILTPTGSLCVELGDTYSGSGGAGGDYNPGGLRVGQQKFDGSSRREVASTHKYAGEWANPGYGDGFKGGNPGGRGWPLPKSLCLIPSSYAWALAYGHSPFDHTDQLEPWRVRNLIVWHRPNPPVGALGDKVRPSTSYVTTACVSDKRWFDLDSERTPGNSFDRPTGRSNGGDKSRLNQEVNKWDDHLEHHPAGAPLLDCWTIPTAPYAGSHYATFPPALPRRLINLMCPRQVCTICGEPRRRIVEAVHDVDRSREIRERRLAGETGKGVNGSRADGGASAFPTTENVTLGWSDCGHNNWRRGIVLDPFAGSGTTLQAASELGRDSIGIDLDSRNLDLARQRLGMFLVEDEVFK